LTKTGGVEKKIITNRALEEEPQKALNRRIEGFGTV